MRAIYADTPDAGLLWSFYARFRRPLLAFFRRRSTSDEAEDLTQEVFVRLAGHVDLSQVDRPESYVFQIAANLLRDRHRRAGSHAADLHTAIDAHSDDRAVPDPLIEAIHPERVLLGKTDLEDIVAILSSMPDRTRDVFVLYRIEGMRQREIAAAMNISLSSVEKHLVKAIARLTKGRNVE